MVFPWFSHGISAVFSAVFSAEYPEEASQDQDTEFVFKQNNPTRELEKNTVEHSRPWETCAVTEATY